MILLLVIFVQFSLVTTPGFLRLQEIRNQITILTS